MEQIEYTPLYYGTPCQVRFYHNGDWIGGIAYHDFIICGCCGRLIPINDVIAMAKEANIHWDNAVIELDWRDIEQAIRIG